MIRGHLKVTVEEKAVPRVRLHAFILYEEFPGAHSGLAGVLMAMLGSLANLTASSLPTMGIIEEIVIDGARTRDFPIIPQSRDCSAWRSGHLRLDDPWL